MQKSLEGLSSTATMRATERPGSMCSGRAGGGSKAGVERAAHQLPDRCGPGRSRTCRVGAAPSPDRESRAPPRERPRWPPASSPGERVSRPGSVRWVRLRSRRNRRATKLVLELSDRPGQQGLRNVAALGRPREVQGLARSEKSSDLVQLHRPIDREPSLLARHFGDLARDAGAAILCGHRFGNRHADCAERRIGYLVGINDDEGASPCRAMPRD